jgi:predicted PurR-regulated permease PerM
MLQHSNTPTTDVQASLAVEPAERGATVETDPVQEKIRARRLSLLALLFLFLYLVFLILQPYLGTLVFAAVLASVCYPFYGRILKWCKGRDNLAAFLTGTILMVIVVVPLASFSAALVHQGVQLFGKIEAWLKTGNFEEVLSGKWVQPLYQMVERKLALVGIEQVHLKKALMNASSALGQLVISWGKEFIGNITGLVIRFLLLIVMVFYLFRDGKAVLQRLKDLSPLSKEQEERLVERIRSLSNSVVLANVVTAAAQGLAGGIGLWISGVPALFWGTMMAFTSLIPVVGTGIVWLPAVCYLFIVDNWGKGLFLAAWSILVLGSIDNFLRPFLMKGKGAISSIYLFLAILGGIQLFGIVGILYGPLILGVAAILLYLYELEYREVLTED